MEKKKKNDKCSLFEEMLMWTSYRYAIGRKSYVTCLATDIPRNYYNRLSPERRQFTAGDIRKEIGTHLEFMPFKLNIRRMYSSEEYNPINALLEFIRKENIQTQDELVKYSTIEYDAHDDKYVSEKKEPTINSYFSISDIDDLIPWETFASCFDEKNYKAIDGDQYFRTWTRKIIPYKKEKNCFINADFGWTPIWIKVSDFLKDGEYSSYIKEEDFLKMHDKEKEE